jgi:hypothetical protein
VVEELVAEFHFAAAIVAEVEHEVGDALLVDVGNGFSEEVF